MICPNCGARNTAEAPWCTQCLRPFASDPEEPSAPARSPDPGATAARGQDHDRPFRTVDGEVEWRCPACDNWNLLAMPTCAVCGHALASSDGRERLADRMARARRPLWVVAGIGAVVMIVSAVLLVLALRGGAAA